MRGVLIVKVIPIDGQPGGTGPPLSHEARLLEQPMMPIIQHAQRAATLLRPAANLRFQILGSLHPSLAPMALVLFRRQHPVFVLGRMSLCFHGMALRTSLWTFTGRGGQV